MARERIVLVEDEEDIAELIRFNLGKEGFSIEVAPTGETGLDRIRKQSPDLVLLDLMLPGIDGFEVCRRLKASASTASIPVVMLTARGEDADIVTGLELGAEDYITKPFSPKVLVARVRAVLRRGRRPDMVNLDDPSGASVVRKGALEINPGRHEVRLSGERVELTPSEFGILRFLVGRPGWVFTRNQIIQAVRGGGYHITERAVDVQIVGLRKKLGAFGAQIETVRGVGYRFSEEIS